MPFKSKSIAFVGSLNRRITHSFSLAASLIIPDLNIFTSCAHFYKSFQIEVKYRKIFNRDY